MVGFRGGSAWNPVTRSRSYAGVAGADLENAPTGPVPFTSPFGLPVGRPNVWRPATSQVGADTGGVPGQPVQRISGNPGVSTVQSTVEQLPYGGRQLGVVNFQRRIITAPGPGPVAQASSTGDPNIGLLGSKSQFGYPRVLQQGQETAIRAPGNAPVGYSNDKLVTYDRHAIAKVGYENSGRLSGQTDPPMDGPARPAYMLLQRALNYQQGTDTTGATDDLGRDYTRNAQRMYIGEQGTGWAPVYGGVPGLWQEYGSYQGVSPTSRPVGNDTSIGIHSPVPEGQAGDGPNSVWSGPPHGLHSPTLPDYSQTIGRYMAIPQMARPRIDRPSNSPIAGQSFSQTVISQGQTGFNKTSQVMARSGFNSRSRGNGWRGRASGLCR
jgi:hypothetical protein